MNTTDRPYGTNRRLLLRNMEVPTKALASAVIMVFGIAMAGALGQIFIHDILPRLETKPQATAVQEVAPSAPAGRTIQSGTFHPSWWSSSMPMAFCPSIR